MSVLLVLVMLQKLLSVQHSGYDFNQIWSQKLQIGKICTETTIVSVSVGSGGESSDI